MSYPKPLIYFRKQNANLPASILPSNVDPANLGIQISSIGTFQLAGTPTAQLALIGKGPQQATANTTTINVDNVWSLMGSEVRIYLDSRANQTAFFDPAGEANCPLVFTGNIHEIRPTEGMGTPWYAYSCEARSLIARAERVPVVSPIDNSDSIRFNINALLDDYQPTTGGKSIGQAIAMTLTSYAVAYRLDQQGIGKLTLNNATQTATLPSATEADLSNITLVPPFEFRISGDNVIAAIQQALDAYAPNFSLVIQPDGTIRFPDIRNTQVYSLGLMNDIVDGLNYTKSTLGSYSRVIVRGGPKVVPYYCQWDIPRDNSSYNLDDSPDNDKFNGNMVEYFNYSNTTNTQAKVNYNHTDYTWGRVLLSVGNLSFSYANGTANLPSNQVRLIPATGNLPGSNTTNLQNWKSDELTMIDKGAESRREARVKVNRNFWKIGTGGAANSILRKDSGEFLITTNTEANASTNWSILTTNPNVDRPPTNYNTSQFYYTYDYELYGYTPSGAVTWRRYQINLDAISSTSPLTTTQKGMARRIGNVFPTPVDGLNFSQIGNSNTSGGVNQQRKVWYPECLVEYRQRTGANSTTWLYQAFWAGFRIDPVSSQIILSRPSVFDSGNNNGTYTQKTPPWDTGTGNSTNQPFQIVPYNIKVLLPVYEGTQESVYPHYNANGVPASGESNATVRTYYGLDRDLIVTLPEWYDGRDQSSADQYAKDLWDSLEKPLIQGGFAWVDGVPANWTISGITSTNKVQAFAITSNETCSNRTGSGIEECNVIMTACEIRFPGNRKPYTVVAFTTSRPRVGVPMHDYHTFEEMITRDPYVI